MVIAPSVVKKRLCRRAGSCWDLNFFSFALSRTKRTSNISRCLNTTDTLSSAGRNVVGRARAREIITNEMAQTACFPVALLYSLTFYPSILSSSVSRQSLFLSPVIIIQHKKVQKKRNGMLLQQIRRARAANAIEERNQFPSLSSLLIPGRVHGPREVGIITLDVRGRPLEWTVGVGWAMGPWWWMRSCRPSVVAGSAAQWQRQHR